MASRLVNTLRKVKLYPGDRPSTLGDERDILATMAVAQRLPGIRSFFTTVSYTHLRAHET